MWIGTVCSFDLLLHLTFAWVMQNLHAAAQLVVSL
jgi:hypothetical protein